MSNPTTKSFNLHAQKAKTWDERTELAADLVQIAVLKHCALPRINDIGCGDMKLQTELAHRQLNRSNYEYRGLDLLPQHSSVHKFDITKDEIPRFDISVALGLGEYIDLDVLFRKVRGASNYFVFSHVISDEGNYGPDQVRKLGWVNHLSSAEIESRLTGCGFEVISKRLSTEKLTMLWLCH